jgi:uncharacterized protein YodC (DUF2158 family)
MTLEIQDIMLHGPDLNWTLSWVASGSNRCRWFNYAGVINNNGGVDGDASVDVADTAMKEREDWGPPIWRNGGTIYGEKA